MNIRRTHGFLNFSICTCITAFRFKISFNFFLIFHSSYSYKILQHNYSEKRFTLKPFQVLGQFLFFVFKMTKHEKINITAVALKKAFDLLNFK